jgi:hypothetical protein
MKKVWLMLAAAGLLVGCRTSDTHDSGPAQGAAGSDTQTSSGSGTSKQTDVNGNPTRDPTKKPSYTTPSPGPTPGYP